MKKITGVLWGSFLAAGLAQAAVITASFNKTDDDYNAAANWTTTGIPGQNAAGADFDRGVIAAGRIATTSADTPAPINTAGIFELTVGNNSSGATLNIGHNLTGLKQIRVAGASDAVGIVNQTGGSLTGVANSILSIGTATSGAGTYNLSGGTYSLTQDAIIEQQGTFRLQGDSAVFSVGRHLTLNSSGKLDFVLGTNGVNAIDVGSSFTIDPANSRLVIDAALYTGGTNDVDLVRFGSRSGSFATNNITISGVTNGSIAYDGDRMKLVFTSTNSVVPPYAAERAMVEALGNLTNAPTVYPATGFTSTNGIRAIFYDGQDYTGSPTRVFAWVGIPTNAPTPMPAVVLVHGGGGTAFRVWVEKWNARGYAAIAMDTEGRALNPADPYNTDLKYVHDMGGPQRGGIYDDMSKPLGDQYMYHAVADTILANSLLRSFPEVDPDKIGVMGVSWGGVITSTAMGLDDRFRFAIPVYGCGDMDNAQNWWGATLINNEIYKNVWDPTIWLDRAMMPALWSSWPQEPNFPIDRQAVSYFSMSGQHMVSLIPGMLHGHGASWNRGDSYAFADSIVQDGTPWCLQQSLELSNGVATVVFHSSKTLDQAVLVSATNTGGVTSSFTWNEIPATLVDNGDGTWTATATLPSDTTGWFMNVLNGSLVASSDYQEIIEVTSPSGGLDMDHPAGETQSTGRVFVVFTAPTTVKITEIRFTNESHTGAFANLMTLPRVLKEPSPAQNPLDIEFDNTVAGLTENGQTATATMMVVWENLDGSTEQMEMPIRAAYRTPSMVVYDVSANWSTQTVYQVDDVIIRNGATVTLDQKAAAGTLTVNDDSSTTCTLQIHQEVDLMINGAMVLGAGTGAGVVHQSTGTVMASALTVNASGAGLLSEYNLSGGTVSVLNALQVNANGAFNLTGGTLSPNVDTVHIDGTMAIDGGTFSRSISGVNPDFNGSGSVKIQSGSLSLSGGAGTDMTRLNIDVEVRGGSVHLTGQVAVNGKLRMIGQGGSVELARIATGSSGTFDFELGENGVSPVKVTFWMHLGGVSITVDGTSYTGGAGSITLFDAPTLYTPFNTNNFTVTGFTEQGLDASVMQNDGRLQLMLTQNEYGNWAASQGLSGADARMSADPEGDGKDNLMKYATGGGFPNLEKSSDESFQGLEFLYRRRRDAAARGLAYTLSATSNLISGAWSAGGITETGAGIVDSEFEVVTNRVSTGESGFVRLLVELPE